MPAPIDVAHLRQDARAQPEVLARGEQAPRRRMPTATVLGRERDLASDVDELAIQIQAESAKIAVHAYAVPGRHRCGSARADPVDEEHVRRSANADRRIGEPQRAWGDENTAPAQPLDRGTRQRRGPEVSPSLEDRDLERALEVLRDGRAAGPGAHDDRSLPHAAGPPHVIRPRQRGRPSVIRSAKASRPPSVKPATRPASSDDISRHVEGA